MKKTWIFLSVFLTVFPGMADIHVGGDGRLTIGDDVSGFLGMFGRNYSYNSNFALPIRVAPSIGAKSGEIDGEWKLPRGTTGHVNLFWKDTESGWKELTYKVSVPNPIEISELSLRMQMPLEFNGRSLKFGEKRVLLPEKASENPTLAVFHNRKKAEIPLADGILLMEFRQPVTILVMDNRKFQGYNYTVRILFPSVQKTFSEASLKLRMRMRPYVVKPIDLRNAANRGFEDRKAGDGIGSWNDQGSEMDLSALPKDKLKCGPVTLPLISGKTNPDKTCITASVAKHMKLEPEPVVLPDGGKGEWLYLVHAAAWPPKSGTPAGSIHVNFNDGSQQKIPVVYGRDVGNWWNPHGLDNAMVAWSGDTRNGTPVGVYLSGFCLSQKRIDSFAFHAENGAVWMIAAAGLSKDQIPIRRKDMIRKLKRNDQWRAFSYERSIQPDSAIDFSFLNDAPAGKYGFVKVENGEFVFEKNRKPIRFHGGNLTFDTCYPKNKEEADIMVDRIKRIGYNSVRLHHFDMLFEEDGRLDSLEYLVGALKKNGIYISLDLYTARTGWENLRGNNYKCAVMLIPEARKEFKSFVRDWLTHVNPYTELRWCDDPVFNSISILNENTIFYHMNPDYRGKVGDAYRREFSKWTEKNGLKITEQNRKVIFRKFLAEVYRKYSKEMQSFLRDELGIKVPLTDQNFIPTPNAAAQRSIYDYVDGHLYWDHPSSYRLPFRIRNTSVLSAQMINPREIAPQRIFGKPFTVTEYNYCFPNAVRAECGPIFGTMAAFQQWNGLYRFTYGTARKNMWGTKSGIEIFEGSNDPIQTLGERIIAALFLRGDVSVASDAYPIAVPENLFEDYQENFPRKAQDLMFLGRTGTVLTKNGKPIGKLPEGTRQVFPLDSSFAPDKLPAPHKEWNADFKKQTFSVTTPRSEALVLPGGSSLKGSLLSVKNGKTHGVVAAIAHGEKTLAQTNRILLLHLTDVQVENSKYLENANGNRLYRNIPRTGTLLARRGTAEISLKLADGAYQLYALSPDGKRLYEVPFLYQDGEMRFNVDTFGKKNSVIFAYELQRKNP